MTGKPPMWSTLEPTDWCVIAADEFGVTIDAKGPDSDALIEKMGPAARQEFTDWPTLEPIIYMLVEPEHGEYALLAERTAPRKAAP